MIEKLKTKRVLINAGLREIQKTAGLYMFFASVAAGLSIFGLTGKTNDLHDVGGVSLVFCLLLSGVSAWFWYRLSFHRWYLFRMAILAAIVDRGGWLDTVVLAREVNEITGRRNTYGALFSSLDEYAERGIIVFKELGMVGGKTTRIVLAEEGCQQYFENMLAAWVNVTEKDTKHG